MPRALAVKEDGDVAIAGAVRPTIGRQHHGAQPATLLRGDAGVGDRRPTLDSAPEAGQGLHPSNGVRVQRDQCRQRRVGASPGQQQHLRGMRCRTMDPVSSLGAIARRNHAAERHAGRARKKRGLLGEKHDGRIDNRRPRDVLFHSGERWPRGEIAAPSVAPPPGGAGRRPSRPSRGTGSVPGRSRPGAGIPRRGPPPTACRSRRSWHPLASAMYRASSLVSASRVRVE